MESGTGKTLAQGGVQVPLCLRLSELGGLSWLQILVQNMALVSLHEGSEAHGVGDAPQESALTT